MLPRKLLRLNKFDYLSIIKYDLQPHFVVGDFSVSQKLHKESKKHVNDLVIRV